LPRFSARKKARGRSATGFTRKRHTLYADYSKGDCKFQRDFSTNFCAHAARIFITAGGAR